MAPAEGQTDWQPVCRLDGLEIGRGAAALVHGQAIAVFRVDEVTVWALANHDPFEPHATLAGGIVGRDGEVPFVASLLHRRRFDLRTGECLDVPHVSVTAYDVDVVDGVVRIGRRRTVELSPPRAAPGSAGPPARAPGESR
jgi:nitrite reductase (NADH) small subunit